MLEQGISPPSGEWQSSEVIMPVGGKAEWMLPGRPFSVAGHEISAGLLYRSPPYAVDPDQARCCDVDPSLLVATEMPDFGGQFITLWPSYAKLHPRARLAFLLWNAEGRTRTDIHPHYILLFLYGLERRLILDQALDEATAIFAEIERLAQLYAHHVTVRKVIKKLVDAAELMISGEVMLDVSNWGALDDGVPVAVKLAIGRAARDGQPISADLALLWAVTSVNRAFTLPASLKLPVLAESFRSYLARARPEGLVLRPEGTANVAPVYHASSGDFSVPLSRFLEAVPDIEAMTLARLDVLTLVRNAINELISTQRAKDASQKSKPPAELAEVTSLREPREMGREAVQAWARQVFSNGQTQTLSLRVALKRYRGLYPSRLEKAEIIRLADVLAEIGFGIVPDPRFDIEPARIVDDVVLFLHPQTSGVEASADYRHALLMTMVCMSVARSDGDIAPEELAYIERLVDSFGRLMPGERARLDAERHWMQLVPLPLEPIFRQIRHLNRDERQRLAEIVIGAATADRRLPKVERKFSEALFAALGIAKQTLHDCLRLLNPVNTSEDGAVNSHLASPPESGGTPVDFGAVDELEDLVSAFREEAHALDLVPPSDPDPARPDTPTSASATLNVRVDGLDDRHAAMLVTLLRAAYWSMSNLDELARAHRLFADGAIETINEWAFEEFEDRLFEFEDSGLRLNPDIDVHRIRNVA